MMNTEKRVKRRRFCPKMPKGRAEEGSALDIVERFDTYEDYLDSQLTPTDLGTPSQ